MAHDRMAAMLERLAARHPVLLLDDIDTPVCAEPVHGAAAARGREAAWKALRERLIEAGRSGALSLHLEPEGDCLRVRQRLVTGLEELRLPISDALAASIGHVAERLRLPATNGGAARGFLFLALDRTPLLVEAQLLPCVQGDTLHLQLIRQPDARPQLDELGMDAEQSCQCRDLLAPGQGLIVVSAADRVARERTIRAMAQELISPDRRILCVEPTAHPQMSGCLQVSAKDWPWDRDDAVAPDIDVCDIDCCFLAAELSPSWSSWWLAKAQEQALLVKGSESSNSVRVLARLVAEGASPAALAQGLRAIVFQQAVMGICPRCSRPARTDVADHNLQLDSGALASRDISAWLNRSLTHRYVEAEGCPDCTNTGYGEPMTVFAISPMNPTAREHLMCGNVELAARALDAGKAMTSRVMALAQHSRIALPEAIRVSAALSTAAPRY